MRWEEMVEEERKEGGGTLMVWGPFRNNFSNCYIIFFEAAFGSRMERTISYHGPIQ